MGSLHAQEGSHDLRIAGTITDGATGMPVRQALVTLSKMVTVRLHAPLPSAPVVPPAAALTDATGHLQFIGLEAGSYSYRVTKNGFAATRNAEVALGPSQDALAITLKPLAKIHGRVIDSDGEPMPGVSVRALHSEVQDGRRLTRKDRSVSTDDQGEYRMWNFQPGDYYVVAAGRSGGTAVVVGPTPVGGLAHEGFEPVYYPAAKDRASAGVIALTAGQEFQAELKIQMQPAFRVRGMLRNLAPYQPVTVELVREAGEVSANRVVVNGSTGRFEANDVVPGTYVVRAVQKAGESEMRGEQEIRVERANVDGVVVELSAGVTVTGVVRGTPDQAVPEAHLFTSRNRVGRNQVTLMAVDTDAPSFSRLSAMADEQGKFAIDNVPAGRYRLEIPAFGAYVASATSGSRDVMTSELIVGRGVAPEPLEIVLRSDGGTINGTVDTPKVWVVLCPARGDGCMRLFVAETAFSYPMLSPGDYEVFAVKEIDKLEFRNPAVVRALRGGEKVHVTASGTATVTLKGLAQ